MSVQGTHSISAMQNANDAGLDKSGDLHEEPKAPKRVIAVLTSGGDSAGMNAAVRAVVREGLNSDCHVYIIREGWEGLVRGNDPEFDKADEEEAKKKAEEKAGPVGADGGAQGPTRKGKATWGDGELLKEGEAELTLKGKYLIKCEWDDVRGFLGEGGTLIGTARCAAFREKEGRRKAAYNLIKHGIDALVVCGGDGSLTGADVLRSEWKEHLDALAKEGKITKEQKEKHTHLNITGLVGSIDNDMAMTDLTIGASTALHRICEAVDSISSTASSHSRAFVVEVMGRHCGWLALMAGLATGADYVFVPECPPVNKDWKQELCEVLRTHRERGKRKSIVIVAEGAISRDLEPISANSVKTVLSEELGLDTRVTTLGHTQRGGKPCAYDRVLATLQGFEAVHQLLVASPETPSPMIGIKENKIGSVPLIDAVERTKSVAAAIEAKDFAKAESLRDPEFSEGLRAFAYTSKLSGEFLLPEKDRMRIAILHVGAPAGGMNAATRTAVRYCLSRGHTPIGVYNGFTGMIQDAFYELNWLRVDQWTTRGGSELGTNRKLPEIDAEGIAAQLKKHRVDGMLLIGGFEAFVACSQMEKLREKYPEYRIPMIHLPATVSNNVPVTDWSLGSDTSVNALVDACDAIKQSASASRNRVFVVDCQGGECGYIAVVGALAAGAVIAYTPEAGISMEQLQMDCAYLRKRYQADPPGKAEGRLVIRSEKASKCYHTSTIADIFKEEGKDVFDSRTVSLGHVLQGGVPSPRDRTRAVRLAVRCCEFLEFHGKGLHKGSDLVEETEYDIATIAITGGNVRCVGLKEMTAKADMGKRRPLKGAWWEDILDVVDVMSRRKRLDPNASRTEGTKLPGTSEAIATKGDDLEGDAR